MTDKSSALYNALMLDIQDQEIPFRESLKSCQTAEEAACHLMRENFLKKFRGDSRQREQADSEAIKKFTSCNLRCGLWSERREGLFDDYLDGYFREEIYRFWNVGHPWQPLVSNVFDLLDHARPGPGVTAASKATDFYTKLFADDITVTSRFLEVSYLTYFNHYPLWFGAELLRRSEGFVTKYVSGNRLACVPKNDDISRTIAIEPTLNIFFQLGLGNILTRRLQRHFNIDLSNQPFVNRELARQGSLDGRFVTIDLESASDSISWNMIRHFFPKDFTLWLKLLRSPVIELPDGSTSELNMVSTMGNGFTFPLQTIIFSCAVCAVARYLGVKRFKWSVFGDDIIVPVELAGPLVSFIERLGFQVNGTKSFFEGPFRESCGSDYFRGRNVRAVYVKQLKDVQDRFSVLNQLNHWSARTGLSCPRACKLLLRMVPKLWVPYWENDDAGIKVPIDIAVPKRSKRYAGSFLYQVYRPRPQQIQFFETGVARKGSVKRIYNPDAVLLSMLRGDLVNGRLSIRHNTTLYRKRLAVAPNWDFPPLGDDLSRVQQSLESGIAPDYKRHWETSVRLNLLGDIPTDLLRNPEWVGPTERGR